MNIKIKATNFALTPAITGYIEKRLDGVNRFFDRDPSAICDFEVGKTSGHHKKGDIFRAEAHIVAARRDIYADSEQIDLYAAIDSVRDEILHRLSSDKGKHLARIRRGGRAVKEILRGFWRGRS